jgi:selenide,water dikinase
MSTHESVVLGFDGADDAAAVRLKDGNLLIQTVDFFTPIVDEPYEFGQIAAANSLSDIYAMGGKPLFALNIVGFPINDLPKAILTEILQGGADKAAEAGIPIVGGHSVDDKEPKYGLVVTGEVDESKMWKNSGAEAGDVLVLTKPLGTGVIATAIKKGAASQNSIHSAIHAMAALNKDAADHLHGLDVHAVTDVTGFGLLGHLKEMCQNSGVSSKINFSKLNFLPSVFDLAESGIMAGGTRRNLDYLKDYVSFGPNLAELEHLLAADAQTSGGLLISLPNEDAQKFVHSYGPPSRIIGNITEKNSHLITLL